MGEARIDEAIASGRVPKGTAAYLNESRDRPALVSIFVTSLTGVIVTGRLLSRAFIVRRFGFDDGMALLSLMTLVAFICFCLELINLGSGRHFAFIKYVLPTPTVQRTPGFYLRICSKHRGFLISIRSGFGLLFATYVPQLLLIIFHCKPVTGLWPYPFEPGFNEYTCLPWGAVYVTNSSISLFCDFLIFGIPVAILRILNTPRRRKIELSCILLPGVSVVAISVARLALVVLGQWEADMSWRYSPMLAVEVSKIGATLIALSVPGFKPLVDKYILLRDIRSHSIPPDNPRNDIRNGAPPDSLELRSYGVLGKESTAVEYEARVSSGSQPTKTISQERIPCYVQSSRRERT